MRKKTLMHVSLDTRTDGNMLFLGYPDEYTAWAFRYLLAKTDNPDANIAEVCIDFEAMLEIDDFAKDCATYYLIKFSKNIHETHEYRGVNSYIGKTEETRKRDEINVARVKDRIVQFLFYYKIAKALSEYYDIKEYIAPYDEVYEAICNNDYAKYCNIERNFIMPDSFFNRIKRCQEKSCYTKYRLNFFLDEYIDTDIQRQVNDLLYSRYCACNLYTSANKLCTYNTSAGRHIEYVHDYSMWTFKEELEFYNESEEDTSEIKISDCDFLSKHYKVVKDAKIYYQGKNVIACGLSIDELQSVAEEFRERYELVISFKGLSKLETFCDGLKPEEKSRVYEDYVLYEIVNKIVNEKEGTRLRDVLASLTKKMQAIKSCNYEEYRKLEASETHYNYETLRNDVYSLYFVVGKDSECLTEALSRYFAITGVKSVKIFTADNEFKTSLVENENYILLKSRKLIHEEELEQRRIRNEEIEKEQEQKRTLAEVERQEYHFVPVVNILSKPSKPYFAKKYNTLKIPKSEYIPAGTSPIIVPDKPKLDDINPSYYEVEELMNKLPVSALPLSLNFLSRSFPDATSIKDIYEAVLINAYSSRNAKKPMVGINNTLAFVGLDVFTKKSRVTSARKITTLDKFYKGYDDNLDFVTKHYKVFLKYVLQEMAKHYKSYFIPIIGEVKETPICDGNYYSYQKCRDILENNPRVAEVVALYMGGKEKEKEEPFAPAVKRLMITPSRKRSVVKKMLNHIK